MLRCLNNERISQVSYQRENYPMGARNIKIDSPECRKIIGLLLLSVISLTTLGVQRELDSAGMQSGASQKMEAMIIHSSFTSIGDEEVNSETWRTLKLEMHTPDGSTVRIDLLRPVWWLEETGAKVGETLILSIPELGINGPANVLKLGPCLTDSNKSGPENTRC